ncbi:P-loop containing nucleoside triphosphate hydrolase protein [Trametes cingulata]|nr:P-loop containing nucleoside triphosphate hydrolase protein [Trametes cingulata]
MKSIIEQRLIPSSHGDDISIPRAIRIHQLSWKEWGLLADHLNDEEAALRVCGVSLSLSKENGGVDVAFSARMDVFHFALARDAESAGARGRSTLAPILNGSLCAVAGFGMARLALHLHRQTGLHVEGVDLATLPAVSGSTKPQTAAEFAESRIHPDVDRNRIQALWYEDNMENLCLRAWLSAILAESAFNDVCGAQKVRTSNLPDTHLECLSRLVRNVELLEAEQPTQVDSEFESVEVGPDGQLLIRNARYHTRVRRSKQTSVIVETTHGESITGKAVSAVGKQTGIRVTTGGGNFRSIERIRVVGREERTNAEVARDEFVLRLLQGDIPSLVDSRFIEMLWFDAEGFKADGKARRGREVEDAGMELGEGFGARFSGLNASQREVVAAMLAEDEPLVIVHGPPGTGKTTTIAAALGAWEEDARPAWVVAQSNVAVKNIARTLVKKGVDFRLLVSKEFYVEWHEHLYEEIEERLIRSDELFADPVDTERKLAGVTIVLCTISMLSKSALDNCGVFRFVPVERLVVDEASQIDTFEFMHLFHKFRALEKVCMFGDPKQLPPYGKETAPDMQTIFDFKRFKPTAYFLNTQYRMPVPLGEFISEHVYDSKLKSVHAIRDRASVCLVDVRKGQEERVGSSWKVSIIVRSCNAFVDGLLSRMV